MTNQPEAHPVTVPNGIDEASITQHSFTTRDDVELYYEIVGDGDATMVLANGLGARLYSWGPVLRHFKDEFQFLIWDYRGLFESGAEGEIRRLNIMEHAEDLNELLETEGVDSAVVTGWSMGVQVGLEFASLYPESVEGLVLLNGSFGHIFYSGFQPLLPIPYMHGFLHKLVEWARQRKNLLNKIGQLVQDNMDTIVNLQLALSPGSTNRDEMRQAMRQYVKDIFGTDLKNYLRLFQELDAHSVYHKLPEIKAPALVFSGGLDVLTPTYDSKKIHRRLPNSRHRHLWLANHFAMLEYPQKVVEQMRDFFKDHQLLPHNNR
ncbi:MAG: alpha/beta fold hydrolase [bacterium]